MAWSLDGLVANAVETAPNGVVNRDTVFRFRQSGDRVWAAYTGGPIRRGYLVGEVVGDAFTFRYCQIEGDGTIDGGESRCRVRRSPTGLIQVVEHFAWASRPGGGTNVIQQLPTGSEP